MEAVLAQDREKMILCRQVTQWQGWLLIQHMFELYDGYFVLFFKGLALDYFKNCLFPKYM
jgi:hypothetical protein